MSNEENNKEMKELLKQAIVPVKDTELRRDLWPSMLQRLSRQPVRVPWYDWALMGLLAMWVLYFPQAIPVLLYHL
ncbi:MAG: hypothetical protein WBB89_01975 [Candidatus Acidiferrum sp.]